MSSFLKNEKGGTEIAILFILFLAGVFIWAIHGVRHRDDFKAGDSAIQKIVKDEKAQAPLISLRLDAVNNDSAKATVVDETQKLSHVVKGGEILVTVFARGEKRFLCLQPTDDPKERITLEIR